MEEMFFGNTYFSLWDIKGTEANKLRSLELFPCRGKPALWFKYSNSVQDTSATQSYTMVQLWFLYGSHFPT